MKKIISFEDRTLKRLVLHINYERELDDIFIDNLTNLYEAVKQDYPKKLKLWLFPRNIQTVRLAPLTFFDKDGINRVEVGQDFTIFLFDEYKKWEKELPKILNFLENMKTIINLPKISTIILTYVDEFFISKEPEFKYNDYFTFPKLSGDDNWNIKFDDFTIGFIPFRDPINDYVHKVVLRFKGRGIEDNKYIFTLETLTSIENCLIEPKREDLELYLNNCHKYAVHYFVEFLNEKYQKEKDLIVAEIEDD